MLVGWSEGEEGVKVGEKYHFGSEAFLMYSGSTISLLVDVSHTLQAEALFFVS